MGQTDDVIKVSEVGGGERAAAAGEMHVTPPGRCLHPAVCTHNPPVNG